MQVRQSDLKTWQKCPLMYRWQHIDHLPRLQSGSLIFGSILHDCVLYLETTSDFDGTIERFKRFWLNPELLDAEYRVDYYVKGTNWRKFLEKGEYVLGKWWDLIQWDSALVLAREYEFDVPVGDGHVLHGTIDKLEVRYRAATDEWVLLISDYKTNNKVPTYGYLEEDLQFTAYAHATLQEEFWRGLFPDPELGLALMRKYADYPRYGEWVQLTDSKRMDAGIRTQRHYNRFEMAVNAMCESIAMRIFVPNISGESCRYCEFRNQCGLPEIVEEDA